MIKHNVQTSSKTAAALRSRAKIQAGVHMASTYKFVCWRNGAIAWEVTVQNLVTDVGLDDLLSKYFLGAAYTAAWFVGLVTNTGFTGYAATDTMASHPGWTESVVYSQANRVAWTGGAVSGGSVDNSASQASFDINGSDTVRGAFMVSNNVKSGTTGILYGEADFSNQRQVLPGDTLNVTITLTAS